MGPLQQDGIQSQIPCSKNTDKIAAYLVHCDSPTAALPTELSVQTLQAREASLKQEINACLYHGDFNGAYDRLLILRDQYCGLYSRFVTTGNSRFLHRQALTEDLKVPIQSQANANLIGPILHGLHALNTLYYLFKTTPQLIEYRETCREVNFLDWLNQQYGFSPLNFCEACFEQGHSDTKNITLHQQLIYPILRRYFPSHTPNKKAAAKFLNLAMDICQFSAPDFDTVTSLPDPDPEQGSKLHVISVNNSAPFKDKHLTAPEEHDLRIDSPIRNLLTHFEKDIRQGHSVPTQLRRIGVNALRNAREYSMWQAGQCHYRALKSGTPAESYPGLWTHELIKHTKAAFEQIKTKAATVINLSLLSPLRLTSSRRPDRKNVAIMRAAAAEAEGKKTTRVHVLPFNIWRLFPFVSKNSRDSFIVDLLTHFQRVLSDQHTAFASFVQMLKYNATHNILPTNLKQLSSKTGILETNLSHLFYIAQQLSRYYDRRFFWPTDRENANKQAASLGVNFLHCLNRVVEQINRTDLRVDINYNCESGKDRAGLLLIYSLANALSLKKAAGTQLPTDLFSAETLQKPLQTVIDAHLHDFEPGWSGGSFGAFGLKSDSRFAAAKTLSRYHADKVFLDSADLNRYREKKIRLRPWFKQKKFYLGLLLAPLVFPIALLWRKVFLEDRLYREAITHQAITPQNPSAPGRSIKKPTNSSISIVSLPPNISIEPAMGPSLPEEIKSDSSTRTTTSKPSAGGMFAGTAADDHRGNTPSSTTVPSIKPSLPSSPSGATYTQLHTV